MKVKIRFAVEGMPQRDGGPTAESVALVLRALEEAGLSGVSFDRPGKTFVVEFDSADVSFEAVREAVRRAGEKQGGALFVVVMSP